MAKLLKMVEELSTENMDLLYEIQSSVEARLDFVDDREPESDGEVHDTWEEKRDALEEVKDLIDEKIEEIETAIEEIKEAVNGHQSEYGGLSRW